VWSKVNEQHIAELTESGLITDAGQRAVDIAQENGAWAFLEPRRRGGGLYFVCPANQPQVVGFA